MLSWFKTITQSYIVNVCGSAYTYNWLKRLAYNCSLHLEIFRNRFDLIDGGETEEAPFNKKPNVLISFTKSLHVKLSFVCV